MKSTYGVLLYDLSKFNRIILQYAALYVFPIYPLNYKRQQLTTQIYYNKMAAFLILLLLLSYKNTFRLRLKISISIFCLGSFCFLHSFFNYVCITDHMPTVETWLFLKLFFNYSFE